MNEDELLDYYQQELSYIRQLGAIFSEKHPKIAGHLRLDSKAIADPHVERLIEAFAFLTARIQHNLKDDFSEINTALLEVLFPYCLSPIPSLSIVQFQIDKDKLTNLKKIAKNTQLVIDKSNSESSYFSTCYSVDLLPIFIEKAGLFSRSFFLPQLSTDRNIYSVFRLSLSCLCDKINFSDLEINRIRFFIHAQAHHAYLLYELLCKHTVTIALADSCDDKYPVFIDKNCLRPVGFDNEESLLLYDTRVSSAHRLLTDFFSFPDKFLFFDIKDINDAIVKKITNLEQKLEIFIYLDKLNAIVEKNITADNIVLNCSPVVNLFEKYAEPINLTSAKSEYHLVPDARRSPQATEVYMIQRILVSNEEGYEIECKPFNGLNYDSKDETGFYYHVMRKPAWQSDHCFDQGTEIFLSFIDAYFNSISDRKMVVRSKIVCTNRDLPGQLPFGSDTPQFEFFDNKFDVINKIKCLLPITPSRRPALKSGVRWRLISHLALNHLSLLDISALQNILQLYDFDGAQNNLRQGLLNIKSHRVAARNPDTRRGNVFWQGTEIVLTVDESKFTGTSLFLFGCVLERFFALYCTINSFTQLVITTPHQGELYRWPPRAGEKVLV